LFSNTLSLCFFLSVRDQVSHPYKLPIYYLLLHININTKQVDFKWDQPYSECSFFGRINLLCWIEKLRSRTAADSGSGIDSGVCKTR
jgi:hypothetical protein